MKDAEEKETRFSFYKGSDNVVALKDGSPFAVSYTHLTLPTNREV